uniref:hypothetical protein n=1 Tax=Nocardioides terrisoli TaxID=3388267 RepID=UPI0037C71C61
MTGSIGEPGPAVVWMRPRLPLLPGEEMSPWQRLLCCADSASGASARLDPAEWAFLNTELTVHLVRPPRTDWICLDAVTEISGNLRLATATIHDDSTADLVGRSAQQLLVTEIRR